MFKNNKNKQLGILNNNDGKCPAINEDVRHFLEANPITEAERVRSRYENKILQFNKNNPHLEPKNIEPKIIIGSHYLPFNITKSYTYIKLA